jgi:vacuolar-type H+-ATPase subunit I/STV1
VKAVESTNALDQMMENLNLSQQNPPENHLEIFSEDFSADDDQDDQTDEKISQQSQKSRRSERERKASKLAERIIQYDPRKKMSRANVIVENKFAYKKIPQCYTHMIKILITLINSNDQSNSSDSDESQNLNEAIQRAD